MSTVRARTERTTSRLRVFREEEFLERDDQHSTDDPPPSSMPTRPARDTQPSPMPRPPRDS